MFGFLRLFCLVSCHGVTSAGAAGYPRLDFGGRA